MLCSILTPAVAQHFEIGSGKKNVSVPFRLIRNMVVIQMQINSKGPYNFILDTGVGIMIITDPTLADSITTTHKRTIKLTGLAEGEAYEAFATAPLDINIADINSVDVAAAILKKDYFDLSAYVGIPVHGLLGYDFFNSLAVKLNFEDSTLNVCKPEDLKKIKKSHKVAIVIDDKKPYLETLVTFTGGKKTINKLIIDIGAGHPLSLENLIVKNGLPPEFIAANLGVALNGPITGFVSRIKEIDIGKYKLKNVITSFPDVNYAGRQYVVPRDGNIGIGILKKFNVVFNYRYNALYLKPNSTFKDPFEFDMSGLEYYAGGKNYERLIISRVTPGSPADLIGLEKDDEIVAINFKPVIKMGLEAVDALLRSRNARTLLLDVFHDHKYDRVILTLKRRI